jgi:hypothetical protein
VPYQHRDLIYNITLNPKYPDKMLGKLRIRTLYGFTDSLYLSLDILILFQYPLVLSVSLRNFDLLLIQDTLNRYHNLDKAELTPVCDFEMLLIVHLH